MWHVCAVAVVPSTWCVAPCPIYTPHILQHAHCNTLQHTATYCNTPQHHPAHTATHTLQHAATHCNTPQH